MRIPYLALCFCMVLVTGCVTQQRETDLVHVELTKQGCAERRVTIHKEEPAIVAGNTLALMTLEVPKAEKDASFQDGRTSFEAGDENRLAKFSLDFSCKGVSGAAGVLSGNSSTATAGAERA